MVHAIASNDEPAKAGPRLKANLNLQRKAALVFGGALDHAGEVRVVPIEGFDLNRTIFGGIESKLSRMIMQDKVAKQAYWSDRAIDHIESQFRAKEENQPTPEIDEDLIRFMQQECDFSMEHADGTFLEHLVFCHDYSARYYPEQSANVALLHSILGTATNTFAMKLEKLPKLKERITASEATQIEVFPTLLRLFYDQKLLPELGRNLHRLDKLSALRCHRVIDNAPLVIEAEELWVCLNFHLMHFVDFMPPANWGAHRSDPLLQQFELLSSFLDQAKLRRAKVVVDFPKAASKAQGETPTLTGWIADVIPSSVKMSMTQKTIRKYSSDIGHSLHYQLEWK